MLLYLYSSLGLHIHLHKENLIVVINSKTIQTLKQIVQLNKLV